MKSPLNSILALNIKLTALFKELEQNSELFRAMEQDLDA
jgi:hypothetical protein